MKLFHSFYFYINLIKPKVSVDENRLTFKFKRVYISTNRYGISTLYNRNQIKINKALLKKINCAKFSLKSLFREY